MLNKKHKKIVFLIILNFCSVFIFHIQAQDIDTTAEGYVEYYYPNGRVSSRGVLENEKPNGYWYSYFPDGVKKSEGNRMNYELEGLWIFYDEDGDTLEKINYHRGLKNGFHSSFRYNRLPNGTKKGGLISKELYYKGKRQNKSYYYKNGKLYEEFNYKDNKKNGLGKEFNEQGRIIAVYEYRNDVLISKKIVNQLDNQNNKQGIWVSYWPNDRLKTEAEYLNNQLHGFYKEFDVRGQLIKNLRYFHGELREENISDDSKIRIDKRTDEEGNTTYFASFRDSIPVGEHFQFNSDGNVYKSTIYDDFGRKTKMGFKDEKRRKTGHWINYYEDGSKESEGNYKNGRKEGKWIYYFADGSLEQEGFFKNGKLDGKWLWYYKGGKLRRMENFYKNNEDGEYVEYLPDRIEIVKGSYVDGLKEGDWIEYINGHLAKGKYKDGLKEGQWLYYYSNGNIKFDGNFYQGQLDGKQELYYNDGKLKEEQFYVFGSKEKKWIFYYADGTMFMNIRYRNNKEYRINGKRIDK